MFRRQRIDSQPQDGEKAFKTDADARIIERLCFSSPIWPILVRQRSTLVYIHREKQASSLPGNRGERERERKKDRYTSVSGSPLLRAEKKRQMVNKDYYAILGISRWATDDEIKRAYKQKALKHHPDKNRDDVDAEKRFTEIGEAYEMLSDPYKRAAYDRSGSDDIRNFFNSDSSFRRSYSSFSSGFNSMPNSPPAPEASTNYLIRSKDPTTFHDLYVTLEEVSKGAVRKLKITRKRFKMELNAATRDEKVLEIQIKPGWKEGKRTTG